MESADARLSCRCGKVAGWLLGASAAHGNHLLCHCVDCQAFARFLGATEALDGNGGTAIYQTLPGRVMFERGLGLLRALRLSETGILRWYTECCRTPFGNTLASPGLRFVGMPLLAIQEAEEMIGPLTGSLFAKEAPNGTHPPADFGLYRAGVRVILRHLSSLVGFAPGGSPYFTEGKPVSDPRVLTEEERRIAYDSSGSGLVGSKLK